MSGTRPQQRNTKTHQKRWKSIATTQGHSRPQRPQGKYCFVHDETVFQPLAIQHTICCGPNLCFHSLSWLHPKCPWQIVCRECQCLLPRETTPSHYTPICPQCIEQIWSWIRWVYWMEQWITASKTKCISWSGIYPSSQVSHSSEVTPSHFLCSSQIYTLAMSSHSLLSLVSP